MKKPLKKRQKINSCIGSRQNLVNYVSFSAIFMQPLLYGKSAEDNEEN